MVTQNYTISTVKTATPPKVKMSQYDYGMRTITFAVVDGSGAAVDLTGKTVTVEGTRIDGHAFATTCTVADNVATFIDTVDMTNAAGDHPAELVVRQNDERLGTMNFIISVEPAAMDEGADVSPEDKNLFEQLYAKVVSGSPVAVDTVAEMTNTDGVYLYTGNESGYTKGYWYYYDGSAWVAGGAYGSGATDKTLTLSDVAADAKVVGDYLDEISEGILESYVTEGSYTSQGVTTERISDTELKVYGTCTANRRFNVYNGFQTIRTTSSPFQAMLPAGTYRVSLSANKTTGNPRVTFTYTTYADALWTVLNGQTVVYEFTQPFMFGFYANTNINYGTEDDPTIVTLRIESLTAKDEVARETKADKDGVYPDLTAGQLYTEKGVENVEPYFFRAVPAAASEARLRKLVGGTVAWNQKVQNGNFADTSVFRAMNGTFTVSGNVMTFTGNSASNTPSIAFQHTCIANHKYLMTIDVYPQEVMSAVANLPLQIRKENLPANTWTRVSGLAYLTTDGTSDQSIYFNYNGQNNGKVTKFRNYMLIDLTQLFGSTIADYIYSLEQSTAGAGVSLFKALFPKDYYPYNAGGLESVEGVSEKATVGFNQLTPPPSGTKHGITFTSVDGKVTASGTPTSSNNYHLGTVKLIAGQTYYFSGCPSGGGSDKYGIRIYNSADSTLLTADYGSGATYTPDADVEVIVAIAYWYNYSLNLVFAPCVNISDPSRNGTFEQYVSHTYPLDSTLTLRGIPKLADGKMYFDGDEYLADGTVKRKYGVVDLGTLTWAYDVAVPRFYSTGLNTLVKAPSVNTLAANAVIPLYDNTTFDKLYSRDKANHTFALGNTGALNIIDTAYTDAASFKTAMSGVYLVYELATPTTETADPFTESQTIDPYGTEEFVSTGIVPVGHDTLYVDDLKQRLEDIAPPTTDGTYTLQVTVSGGKPTFSWVTANRSLSMGNPFASATEDEPTEETEETTEETEEPVEEGDQR